MNVETFQLDLDCFFSQKYDSVVNGNEDEDDHVSDGESITIINAFIIRFIVDFFNSATPSALFTTSDIGIGSKLAATSNILIFFGRCRSPTPNSPLLSG